MLVLIRVQPEEDGVDEQRVTRHSLHWEHQERAHVKALALAARLQPLDAAQEGGVL